MKVNIDSITIDPRLQSRAAMNDEAVEEYAEAIKAGTKFDPVMCFEDGDTLWLVEGFHRVKAHIVAGVKSIDVETREGGFRAAWIYSLGTNHKHGARRTNADKRKVVEAALKDAELVAWPLRELAEHLGVSHMTIARIRDELKPAPAVTSATSHKSLEVLPKKEAAQNAAAQAPASATSGTDSAGTTPDATAPESPPQPEGGVQDAAAPDAEGDADPSQSEQDEAERHRQEAIEHCGLVLLDDEDPLNALVKENVELRVKIGMLESRIAGLMNEKNMAIRALLAIKKKLPK